MVFPSPLKQMPGPYHKLWHNCFSKPFPIHYSLIPPFDNILSWVTDIMTEHHLKIVPVHTMKAYRGSTGIAPLSFNLGTRWTWVINFMPQPFYAWKTASIPTEYRTRGLSESVWKTENLSSLPGLESQTIQTVLSPYAVHTVLDPSKLCHQSDFNTYFWAYQNKQMPGLFVIRCNSVLTTGYHSDVICCGNLCNTTRLLRSKGTGPNA